MTEATEPATFLTVPLATGGTWTRLDRLTDGRVMCCLCFAYRTREELNPLPEGGVEDVCKACAALERVAGPATGSEELSGTVADIPLTSRNTVDIEEQR